MTDGSIISGNVFAIVPDRDGALWFGTEAGKRAATMSRWQSLTGNPDCQRPKPRYRPDKGRRSLVCDPGRAQRLSGRESAAKRGPVARGLPGDLHTLTVASISPLGGGARGSGEHQQGAGVRGRHPGHRRLALAGRRYRCEPGRSNGDLIVGVNGSGVCWRRRAQGGWRLDDGAPGAGRARTLMRDAGRLWVGARDGVIYQDGASWQRFPLKADDTGLEVYALTPDERAVGRHERGGVLRPDYGRANCLLCSTARGRMA